MLGMIYIGPRSKHKRIDAHPDAHGCLEDGTWIPVRASRSSAMSAWYSLVSSLSPLSGSVVPV